MSPKIQRERPPYRQIADELRRQIEAGELAEGDAVPSVRQLSATWEVAHGTARAALAALRSEGYVVGVPGTGTVVRFRGLQGTGARYWSTKQSGGRIYPRDQYAQIVSADLVAATDEIALAVGVDPGHQVIRRQRVTYRTGDGGPDTAVSMSISWFDGALAQQAPDLLRTDRIARGTFGYIEDQTGRHVTEVLEELELSTASSVEAETFEIESGQSVIRGQNWLLDQVGDTLEYGQSVLRPDRKVSYRFRTGQ